MENPTVAPLDVEYLDQLAQAIAKALRETPKTDTNWDRLLTYVLGVLTVVSLIFTFGVNWSRITNNERRLETLEHRQDTFESSQASMRQEMNSASVTIQSQLGDIKAQLGEIRGALSLRVKE